jgi:probable HAF family extracellular repeat protein
VAVPNIIPGTFITIDVPGACGTVVEGINSRGDMIGNYGDCVSHFHNFVLTNGVFTNIDPPGCFGDSGWLATEMGINDNGDVVGTCFDSNFGMHGYLLSKGVHTILDAPGGVGATVAAGINNNGDIVGWFFDSSGNAHGFLLSGGHYSIIDVPAVGAVGTQPTAINPNGDILGTYQDSTLPISPNTGFLLSRGVFSTFQIPSDAFVTFPMGMNPRGDIVGGECCTSSQGVAFLLSQGTLTIFNAPGASSDSTIPFGINAQGDIVGGYTDSSTNQGHGFLLKKN